MTTPEELLSELVQRFRKDKAVGLEAVYELRLTGDGGGVWHLTIANQECSLVSGPAPTPNATITVSAGDWLALFSGRLDPYTAFFQGRIQLAGDQSLAMKLQDLFGL